MRERSVWSNRVTYHEDRMLKRYRYQQYLKQLARYDWGFDDEEWLEADLRSLTEY